MQDSGRIFRGGMEDDVERVDIKNIVLPFDYMCNCFAGEPESFAAVSQL